MIDTQLKSRFKELHLPAFRETYKDEADTARAESLGYEQYLLAVAEREVEARRMKRIERGALWTCRSTTPSRLTSAPAPPGPHQGQVG